MVKGRFYPFLVRRLLISFSHFSVQFCSSVFKNSLQVRVTDLLSAIYTAGLSLRVTVF